jgi:hypothetical protein
VIYVLISSEERHSKQLFATCEVFFLTTGTSGDSVAWLARAPPNRRSSTKLDLETFQIEQRATLSTILTFFATKFRRDASPYHEWGETGRKETGVGLWARIAFANFKLHRNRRAPYRCFAESGWEARFYSPASQGQNRRRRAEDFSFNTARQRQPTAFLQSSLRKLFGPRPALDSQAVLISCMTCAPGRHDIHEDCRYAVGAFVCGSTYDQ